MNQVSILAWIVLATCFHVDMCKAQTHLSAEQQADVRQMIQASRAELKAEVKAEVLAEIAREATHDVANSQTCPSPHSSQLASSEAAAPATNESPGALPTRVEPASRPESSAEFLQTTSPSTPYDRDVAAGTSGFQAIAGTDGSRASIRWGRDYAGAYKGDGRFTSQAVTMSAPLDKRDPKTTNLATLDGLSNAFELAYSFSRYRMTGVKSILDSSGQISPRVRELCAISKAEQCDDNSIYAGLMRNAPELSEEFLQYADPPGAMDHLYGFKLRAGHERFDYFLTPSLAKAKTDEVPWGISAFYGVLLPHSRLLLTAGAEIQQSYKASPSLTACPTDDTADYLSCVTGSLMRPQSQRKHLLSFEARTQLGSLGPIEDVGLSLRLSHDFKDHATGVDMPIYLFKSEKSGLVGGVRFGWSSTDDLSAGIFVGGDFNVISK